jgi:hypothetical protein
VSDDSELRSACIRWRARWRCSAVRSYDGSFFPSTVLSFASVCVVAVRYNPHGVNELSGSFSSRSVGLVMANVLRKW